MTLRPFLLSVLCLGLVAGCSKPVTPDPMPTDSNPPSQQPAPPPSGSPSGPRAGPSGGSAKQSPVATYVVKNSGIRCIAPPCPVYIARPVDDPNAEGIQIHVLNLEDLSPSAAQREELTNKADTSPDGLKVEAVLEKREKAGPAGDATVLRVRKVLQ